MPGTGNPANYPGPVSSWILEENLMSTVYQTSIIPTYHSKYLLFYPKINVAPTPHQKQTKNHLTKTITETTTNQNAETK